MLLALAQWLSHDVRTFNVLSYITLRAVLAAMTSLFISFMVGPAMIGMAIRPRHGGLGYFWWPWS